MAGSVNKVILVGTLGKDPEIRKIKDGGKEIMILAVITSETWRNKETKERREKVEWHRVVVFTKGLVKIISRNLFKGAKVYVEGAIHRRPYKDENGEKRYITEIVLQGFNCTLAILDSRGYRSNENQSFGDGDYKKQASGNKDFIDSDYEGGDEDYEDFIDEDFNNSDNNAKPKDESADDNYDDDNLDDDIPF